MQNLLDHNSRYGDVAKNFQAEQYAAYSAEFLRQLSDDHHVLTVISNKDNKSCEGVPLESQSKAYLEESKKEYNFHTILSKIKYFCKPESILV